MACRADGASAAIESSSHRMLPFCAISLLLCFGLDPVLTRKDLAMVGVPGKPRRGYPAKDLLEAINHALGWDNTTDAILVGAGSLGHALLGYSGFEEQNLSISLAFDANPELIGQKLHGIKVCPMEDLPRIVKRLKIKVAILTVPNSAAQECTDQLVAAGICGILNFTTVQVSVNTLFFHCITRKAITAMINNMLRESL